MAIDIPLWLQRINRTEQLQSEKREERLQAIKLYTGTFFGKPTDTRTDRSEVNFLYEFVDVMISSIYARNPFIFCRALSSKWSSFAESMQTAINHYWKDKEAKKKFKLAIKDAILQPPGFMMAGYMLITEKNQFKKDLEKEFPELKSVKKERTESQQGISDETIKDDDVFLSHVSSWNVLWPDGYHDIRQCPYMIIKEQTTLEDVLANPMWKDSKYDIQSGGVSHVAKKPTTFKMNDPVPPISTTYTGQTDKETIPIVLYHVWDRRGMQRFTLAQNFYKDTLKGPDLWEYLPDGFPVFPIIFNDIPQTNEKANSYPLSDVVPMLPQLKELSLISSAMLRHRKRSGTVIMAEENSIEDTQASNIQNASDVDLVFVRDINKVQGFTPPALPRDFYNMREVILQDLLRISGFNQLLFSQRGIETATESENVREGARLRQSHKVDVIEDVTISVARYLSGLIWQYKDRREIEEIIGEPLSEEMWPSLPRFSNGDIDEKEARRIIQKEIFFRIDAGSTRPPKDEAIERKQYMDFVGILKANFPGRFKEDLILKQILKKFDFKDIENTIISFDEEEIKVAQQENKLLLQGIPQVVGPNENHMLHLKVHSQAEGNATIKVTPEMDNHILQHVQFMEQQQGVLPQEGDSKVSPRTTTPDLRRQGVTEFADIQGAIKNIRGVGGNTGGG